MKVFHSLTKFRFEEATNFSSWVYRIAINCSIDHLRRNNKMKRDRHFNNDGIQREPAAELQTNPEYTGQLREVREKLEQMLGRLSSRQRMIFILRHYQQLNTKEISEFLNCSEGSVKKQLFRAIFSIKKDFRSLFPEASYEMQEI